MEHLLDPTPAFPHAPPAEAAGSANSADPRHLSAAALAQRDQRRDAGDMYEVFRRALVERDDAAWEQIYATYSAMVHAWVRRSEAFAGCCETADALVNAAFARLWQAVSPAAFASFPTLPALLQYLRRCACAAVIDAARSQQRIALFGVPDADTPAAHDEDAAINCIDGQDVWRLVEAQLHSEAERVVVHYSFVLGMKPGQIYEQRPDLFDEVAQVYRHKRNVLERLERVDALRRLVV